LPQRCIYVACLFLFLELQPAIDGLTFNEATIVVYPKVRMLHPEYVIAKLVSEANELIGE
jgi:hypothetical protein